MSQYTANLYFTIRMHAVTKDFTKYWYLSHTDTHL